MKPVIKNRKDFSNPVLGSNDGAPTVISLYHDHAPGESSKHHSHNNGKEILSRITFNPLISESEI